MISTCVLLTPYEAVYMFLRVLQCVTMLLKSERLVEIANKFKKISMCVARIIHDMQHTGLATSSYCFNVGMGSRDQ